MSLDVQHLVDGDEHVLTQVPFGRNYLLRMMGMALFGFVVKAVMPKDVQAFHESVSPCRGPKCHCCSGVTCCSSSCQPLTGACASGGQCWTTCSGGYLYRCCDYTAYNRNTGENDLCVCRGGASACPGCC